MATTGRLADKVAIVTGSSSGLGRAIALLYAEQGASVVCSDLSPSARLPIRGEDEIDTHDLINKTKPGKAIFHKCDVTEPKEMEGLVHSAADKFGRLDM